MTREEALAAMKQGFKVRQEYFTPEEYLYMRNDGVIVSEDGYDFNDWFNIITPATKWKLTGWSIYK